MNGKKIVLFNADGSAVKSFINKAEAQKYCFDNKVCNKGWVSRSLNTGEKFYYPQDRVSRSYNGYEGKGMYVKWVETE